ncbi:MAG: carboxylesterase family protein [Planctomycetota bacterium]|jgi:predicted esterase
MKIPKPPLLLFQLFWIPVSILSASPAFAQSPDLEKTHAILDGEMPAAEAAKALAGEGWDPFPLARALRAWKPAPPPPFHGAEKRPLRATDGRETDLWVYIPKDYRGEKPWPCLVALHGRGANGKQMVDLCRKAADRFGYLVVSPTAKTFPAMLPIHPHWWKYSADGFPLEALRWAKRNLWVDEDRVLLIGYSMGGFGTWNVGLRFPDRFFALAPFAGGISQVEYLGNEDKKRRALLTNAAMVHLFFAHGDADRIVPARFDRASHEALEKAGIPHIYKEIKGGRHILAEVLAAAKGDFQKGFLVAELFEGLKKKKRADLSASFSFTALEAPAGARFVTLEKADSFPCTVKARVQERTLHLDVEGVRKLTVRFDGLLLDLEDPWALAINGKEVYRGKPEPSLETVVKSWRSLRDRRRIFLAEVPLEVPEKEEEGF